MNKMITRAMTILAVVCMATLAFAQAKTSAGVVKSDNEMNNIVCMC